MVRSRYILPISAVVVFLILSSTALAEYGDPKIYIVHWPKTETYTLGDTVDIPVQITDSTYSTLKDTLKLTITYPNGRTQTKSKKITLDESENEHLVTITFTIDCPANTPSGNCGARVELLNYESAQETPKAFKFKKVPVDIEDIEEPCVPEERVYIEDFVSRAKKSNGKWKTTDVFYQDDIKARFKVYLSPRYDPQEVVVTFFALEHDYTKTMRETIEPDDDMVYFDLYIDGKTRRRYDGQWMVKVTVDGKNPVPSSSRVDKFDIPTQFFTLKRGDR